MDKPKHKKLKIAVLVLLLLIAVFVGYDYAIGPRFYTDKTSNEKCIYYKFNSYYSLYGVNDITLLEEHGVVLGEKIAECNAGPVYCAQSNQYDEVLVWDADDTVVFVKQEQVYERIF